jgi:hypothetical protein
VATVNKNFRIKNGLVVEGGSATVAGYDILTKAAADQTYIINLIGGTASSSNTPNSVVKRDGSGNFSAGTITANLTGNVTGDVTGNVTGNLTGNVTGNVTGDVTGTVSSLANHDTDDLTEGSNQYFTDARAKTSAANLLTSANLTNITITGNGAGLTITAENGVADSTTDDLDEGITNLYFTNTRARQAISGGTGISYDNSTGIVSVDNTIATKSYADQAEADAISAAAADATSKANAAEAAAIAYADSLDTDDVSEGSSNLYFTNGRARNAVSAGTGITYSSADGIINVTSNTYDAYGAASAAEAAANSYTDTAINGLSTTDIEEGTNLYYTDARARGAVGLTVNSGLTYDSNSGLFAVDTNIIANKTYVDTAVSNLVDGAPALLDTLNEIAAAINDDANYFTTISNNLATKLNLSGGTMTGALTLSADPVNNLHAATKQYVDQAETDAVSSANSYTDAEVLELVDGTRDFEHVDVNSVSRQIAGTTGNITTAAATTVIQWHKDNYRSAKILVKAKNGTHTHLSELVLTLDTSDNIALNEYAITTTNGSLMTIDADINNSNVRLRVTPANNNTEVMAHATLLI